MKETLARLPLNPLRVFAVAARHSSFSDAAEALNVSAAAVSAQVRALEDYLKVALFRRRHRTVELTSAGVILLPGVEQGLAELQRAVARLRAEQASAPLVVSVLASFLQRWLLPRLHAFYERHPDVELRVHTGRKPVDFTSTDVHLAVRLGSGRWPGLRCRKLCDEWLLPACTPRLARRLAGSTAAQALKRAPLIESTTETWARWAQARGVELPRVDIMASLDDSVAAVEAACQDHGLALVRWSLAKADIEAGRLVIPFEAVTAYEYSYYLVAPAGHFDLPHVRRFCDWILEEGASWPRPPGAQ